MLRLLFLYRMTIFNFVPLALVFNCNKLIVRAGTVVAVTLFNRHIFNVAIRNKTLRAICEIAYPPVLRGLHVPTTNFDAARFIRGTKVMH